MTRRSEIIEVARNILETAGPEGLTMRAIAERIGIRAPSLYKHIGSKAELETALIASGLEDTAEAFEAAIIETDDPLGSIASAYRRWALAHPHLYRLMNDQPLPRSDLPRGLEARAAAPLLAAADGDSDRARAAWAFAHGMVSLEMADRFPDDADLDAAWAAGLAASARQTSTTETISSELR